MNNSAQNSNQKGPISFITTMSGAPWAGSEELWADTAATLLERNIQVSASVYDWMLPTPRVAALQHAGAQIHTRAVQAATHKRAARFLGLLEHEIYVHDMIDYVRKTKPSFLLVNEQFIGPPCGLLEYCCKEGIPYAILLHANNDQFWPDDEERARYRDVFQNARRVFFVSEGNRRLAQTQFGLPFDNSEVVRNTFSVAYDATKPWPESAILNIASVGRLDPTAKGQDLLLLALSRPEWKERAWHLNIYGEGRSYAALESLVAMLDLQEHVTFCGHQKIDAIWEENHVLAQTSRVEGLPITVVEALLSGRPVVTTDVAGNAELLIDNTTGFVAEAPVESLVAEALERMWAARDQLPQMGEAAAIHARKLIPPDPAKVFADKIIDLID